MKKVLLPIDGSGRSLRTIDILKRILPPGEAEVTLLTVVAGPELARKEEEVQGSLECHSDMLEGYTVKSVFLPGVPGPEIVQFAQEEAFDLILMTRSSRPSLHKLGSVSAYVVKHADFVDLIVLKEPEEA